VILPFALDLTSILETVYQILAAGVAITAVALRRMTRSKL